MKYVLTFIFTLIATQALAGAKVQSNVDFPDFYVTDPETELPNYNGIRKPDQPHCWYPRNLWEKSGPHLASEYVAMPCKQYDYITFKKYIRPFTLPSGKVLRRATPNSFVYPDEWPGEVIGKK